jgi:hypothetical protein
MDSAQTQTPAFYSSVLDILLERGNLTQEQYDEINLQHINTGKSFEQILEDKQTVPEEALTQARSTLYSIPYVALVVGVSPEALAYS